MFRSFRWSALIAGSLAASVAGATPASAADDVFVKEGVVVKPLSKAKQRRLERKLLRQPGNKVVIEGTPSALPSPEALAGMKTRSALRPRFGDLFGRRNEVIVGAPIVTRTGPIVAGPSTVVGAPKVITAPGDPLVLPGSAEVTPPARATRPPVVSTPRASTVPVEPEDELELPAERPATGRVLPPPADEIPPPVVSTPRPPAQPEPAPAPAPAADPTPAADPRPPLDPGPVTPPPAGPTLEPRPA